MIHDEKSERDEKSWIRGLQAIGWILSWLLVAAGFLMMFLGGR